MVWSHVLFPNLMLQHIVCPQNLWTSLDYMSHLTLLRIHNTITSLMLSSTPLILETGGFEVSTSLESGCLGIKQAFYLMLHLV